MSNNITDYINISSDDSDREDLIILIKKSLMNKWDTQASIRKLFLSLKKLLLQEIRVNYLCLILKSSQSKLNHQLILTMRNFSFYSQSGVILNCEKNVFWRNILYISLWRGCFRLESSIPENIGKIF